MSGSIDSSISGGAQLKKELEAKLTTLTVAKAELEHLKPDREVYQRVGALLFKSDQGRALKSVTDKLQAATKELEHLSSRGGGGGGGSQQQR